MISVAIIGNGNVATHLHKAFSKAKNIAVIQINSRKVQDISSVDVAIIAVSDDAITKVSSKINATFVVHTSGALAMNTLKNSSKKGVFYPLQSFSKDKKVNFKKVPFCLEAETKEDLQLLETLAKSIGKKIYSINSEQRKRLHLSAVFVNNFTNYLYTIANNICTEHQVPFEILQPLIQETAKKIKKLTPKEAQTGPAKRNDQQTIKSHLEMLNEHQQEIYKLLTQSIQNDGKKL